MGRSELYAARAGALFLAIAVFAIAKWLLGGGSSSTTAALVCLAGSFAAFVLAYRWSGAETAPGVEGLPFARGGAPSPRLFPIADYDDLWVEEILPLLDELDADELEDVQTYERSHAARPIILNQIRIRRTRPASRRGWVSR